MTEKEKKPEVELVEVPTQHELAFKKGEEVLSSPQVLCNIYNLLLDINQKL